MVKMLKILASANPSGSISNRLANEFVAQWSQSHADTLIFERDLGRHPVPVIDHHWLAATTAQPGSQLMEAERQALAVSESLISELLDSEYFVFSVPMYNFNVPSAFKAYIDQVVRVNKTVAYGPSGSEGLLKDKKALVVSARLGDYTPEGRGAEWDFHEPYMRKIFEFMGVDNLAYIALNPNPLVDAEDVQLRKIEAARLALREVSKRWESGRS